LEQSHAKATFPIQPGAAMRQRRNIAEHTTLCINHNAQPCENGALHIKWKLTFSVHSTFG
jgi:hypothetical protein